MIYAILLDTEVGHEKVDEGEIDQVGKLRDVLYEP
jgi:hypothetical protein